MADIAGHFGYFFIVVGMWLLTQKSYWGFAFRLVGETIWAVVGLCIGLTSIWAWGGVFMALDIRGIIKWRRERDVAENEQPAV